MNLFDLFYDIFTFWVCLGVLMFFVLSITELFRPFRSFYDQSPGFGVADGILVIPVAVILWPISLACIVENVRSIRRDARIRHCEYLEKKRQDLHRLSCKVMIARAKREPLEFEYLNSRIDLKVKPNPVIRNDVV